MLVFLVAVSFRRPGTDARLGRYCRGCRFRLDDCRSRCSRHGLKRQLDKSITTPGSGTGGAQTTASATTTQVASPRCRISGCRLTSAAASIGLSVAAALGASLSRHAGKTGSLRRAAGLSRFLGGGTAVPATSTAASTGLGCAALSSNCSLGTWCPNVGTREPGDELPGIENGVAAFGQKGCRVLRTARGRLRRMYRKQTLLIHSIRSRTDDRENVPHLVVICALALGKRALRKGRSRSTRQ